jgi:hypothetical protein
VASYQAGAKQAELAQQFGRHETTIGLHLRKRGVIGRGPRVLTDEQAEELRRLRETGLSYEKLGAEFGVSARMARSYVVGAWPGHRSTAAADGRTLEAIRDPGLLLELMPGPESEFEEAGVLGLLTFAADGMLDNAPPEAREDAQLILDAVSAAADAEDRGPLETPEVQAAVERVEVVARERCG